MASKPIYSDLDLQGSNKIKNVSPATGSGDVVEYSQNVADLATKQDNLIEGAGVKIDGATISVDLSTTDADYGSLTLSGANDAALDGTYTKLPEPAYAYYKSGTDGDYDLRWNTGGFSWFYKDNGNSTWDVILAEDTDGSPNSNNQWSAFRVAINPLTVNGNVTDYVLDSNSGLKFDITNGHDIDDDVRKIPTASDSNVTYDEGTADSFMSFAGGKLKVDVTQLTASATSTNLLSAAATKTYIDEQDVISRAASSNSFSNTAPQYPNNPSNVQSALEEAKDLIDDNASDISGVQTVNTTQTSQIAAHSTVLGVSNGDTDMGTFGGTGAAFLASATTAKEGIEGAAAGASTALTVLGTVLGLGQGESDFGDGFTILPNDEDAKALFQAVELELQTLATGAGATWAAGIVQSVETSNIADLSNPATDVFGGETLSQGDIFLAAGQTAQSENGFYVFDTTSTALVRWADADATEDFIQNRSVQIVSDGTEWAYKGIADPTVDTNILPFEKIRESIIADQAISEAKLDSALSTKLNAKADRYEETGITLVAGVAKQIDHNLGVGVPMYGVYDSLNNEIGIEFDIIDSNSVTIKSSEALTNVKIAIM